MEPVPFEKMHGCGNDFVVLDGRAAPIALTAEAARRIGDRRRGVGFDQLLLIERDAEADARLRFFNTDGSESGACGNGTRCVARYLFDRGAPPRLRLVVGERRLTAELMPDGRIAVDMGGPVLDWRSIPLAEPCDTLEVPLDFPGLPRPVAVNMGNPHLVFLVPDVAALDVAHLGSELERHPILPERGNIGFAQLVAPDRLRLRVFERGAGLTLACGSGSCAAMVAARRRRLTGDRVHLALDGGEVEVAWSGEGPVTLIGPTARVFTGTLAPELLDVG
ncbi:MAG: diaminopimelate epimerase [Geminicoccaceae bacterium]